jgi:hypothetical protein
MFFYQKCNAYSNALGEMYANDHGADSRYPPLATCNPNNCGSLQIILIEIHAHTK